MGSRKDKGKAKAAAKGKGKAMAKGDTKMAGAYPVKHDDEPKKNWHLIFLCLFFGYVVLIKKVFQQDFPRKCQVLCAERRIR